MNIPGLPEAASQSIIELCSCLPEVEKLILYGSRAKGNYRPSSDVDLTLVAPTGELSSLLKLETQLDDLLIPWKIDLSLYHQIDNQALKNHIDRVGIVLWDNSHL